MKKFVIALSVFFFLMSCASSNTAGVNEQPTVSEPQEVVEEPMSRPQNVTPFDITHRAPANWYNDAVFYLMFVRSFQDSDGDGKGDLKGIINRLDYLNDGNPNTTTDLGINAIWLMPIHPSPSNHGYDVIDYFAVNPEYGTMDDLKTLLSEARKRGIRIILDLVINHASNRHPYFLESASGPTSPKRDWFIWSDRILHTRGPWGQSRVWHPISEGANMYYYGVFNFLMPDWNHRNPNVAQMFRDISRFWIRDVGVGGFRLDAVRYLMEEGNRLADSPANVDYLKGFRSFVKSVNRDAYLVGEVWSGTEITSTYVPDAVDQVFSFDTQSAIVGSLKMENKEELEFALDNVNRYLPLGTAAFFLSNHDMDRIMSQLGADFDKAKIAATLLMTAPGTPYIYYGEEIGQQGVKAATDENWRRPMQWGDGPAPGLGFTTGRPWGRGFNQPGVENTVASQTNDPNSLLSWYRQLIRVRSSASALRTGRFVPVDTNSPQVYSFLRWDPSGAYLIVLNLGSRESRRYGLTLWSGPFKAGVQPVKVFGTEVAGNLNPPQINETGGFDFYRPIDVLPPKAALIIKL
jgi:alpha-amylase